MIESTAARVIPAERAAISGRIDIPAGRIRQIEGYEIIRDALDQRRGDLADRTTRLIAMHDLIDALRRHGVIDTGDALMLAGGIYEVGREIARVVGGVRDGGDDRADDDR